MKDIRRYILITAAMVLTSVITGCSAKKDSDPGGGIFKKSDPENVSFSWQEPFEKKLTEFKESGDFTDSSAFDILDVTGDGVPELIISPSSELTSKCTIYKLNDENLLEIGSAGNSGCFSYCPESTLIKDEYLGNGFILGQILSYKEGTLDVVFSYSNNAASASMGAVISYKINNSEVTLLEYEEQMKPYSAVHSINAGRRFTFGDDALRFGLRCSESWQAVLSKNEKELCANKLNEILQATADSEKDPAFDLCDLNGDKVPELIISDGSDPEDTCTVYYFSEDNLVQMNGAYGYSGIISFDTKQFVFFADGGNDKTYWSIANSQFSANDYKESDSIAHIGRKHLLTDGSISAVFS